MNHIEQYLKEVMDRFDESKNNVFFLYSDHDQFGEKVMSMCVKEKMNHLVKLRTDIPKLLKMVAFMDQIIKYTCMNVPESKEWLGGYKETLDMIARGEDER